MWKVAVVEDEQESVQKLEAYIRQYGDENGEEFQISFFGNGEEILASLDAGFDVILLDIEMPVMNGMEAAEAIRSRDENVVLMFITNLAQYAIRGYEVGALDFVLKPVTYFTFRQKFKKAMTRAGQRKNQEILLNVPGGAVRLLLRDLYYVGGQNRLLYYHTSHGDYTVKGTLKNAEEELASHHFVKCNHWYLVNLLHVQEIGKDTVTVAGTELEVSRRSRGAFLDALTKYMGGSQL